ncbi:MAG: response regulator transcription factor [Alphaproteobacteria bacterium GM7ARS4]|nr:response regulator transcription factor [Alphaproteobacteria bacterium GM7ARS4]
MRRRTDHRIIALIDDDRNILASLSLTLENEGYGVKMWHDGQTALHALLKEPVDLVVLDIKMPSMDGITCLRELRRHSSVPVIFLTSKDGEESEIEGLEQGADDYIRKPFSQSLLLKRIEALLRRSLLHQQETRKEAQKKATPLHIDTERHLCTWKGLHVALTVTEFLIVQTLARTPNAVISRDQLLDAAYGYASYVEGRLIDHHIKRIRKKFRDKDPQFNAIDTLYGLGYRYKDHKA